MRKFFWNRGIVFLVARNYEIRLDEKNFRDPKRMSSLTRSLGIHARVLSPGSYESLNIYGIHLALHLSPSSHIFYATFYTIVIFLINGHNTRFLVTRRRHRLSKCASSLSTESENHYIELDDPWSQGRCTSWPARPWKESIRFGTVCSRDNHLFWELRHERLIRRIFLYNRECQQHDCTTT